MPFEGDSYWYIFRAPGVTFATCSQHPGQLWFSRFLNGVFSGWKRVADTGDALMKTDKPSGNYKGNHTCPRTINTSGIGNAVCIHSVQGDGSAGSSYLVIGTITLRIAPTGSASAHTNYGEFFDGVLTVKDDMLNGTNELGVITYYYQVL
jgi:hypothetical protein